MQLGDHGGGQGAAGLDVADIVHAADRAAVAQRLRAAGTPPVTRTTFHYGESSLAVAIKPGDGVDALCAPRRTLLDATLVDAAAGRPGS